MSNFEGFFIGYDIPPTTCIIGYGTPGFKLTERTLKTHMNRSWQAAVEATKAACIKKLESIACIDDYGFEEIDFDEAIQAIRETEVP